MSATSCFLSSYMNCEGGGGSNSSNYVAVSIERLVQASKCRGDGLHELLREQCKPVYCHKNCVSTYASKTHIKRYLSKKVDHENEPTKKRSRRSDDIFSFRKECLFCGEHCETEPDPKNPSRWRRVIQCQTADCGSGRKSFKEVIMETCDLRGDEWSNQVRLRIQGAVSDLHAADAQYHKDCMTKFRSHRNIQASTNANMNEKALDEAFEVVIGVLQTDPAHIWNSVELHELYASYNGVLLSRRQLLKLLVDRFGSDLLVLSGVGVASIVVFKSKAAGHLKLVENGDEDDVDIALMKVAKTIVTESRQLKRDQTTYDIRISLHDAISASSPTFLSLMSAISPKLESSLSVALTGNIVTSAVTNKPTSLQIALGIAVRERSTIELLYDFGVTSSYDEVLRFRASAAHSASKSRACMGLSTNGKCFIQAVADNFDANISSQNGLQSTHALAILMTQVKGDHDETDTPVHATIPRLDKSEMKDDVLPDIPVQRYEGPPKPNMPANDAKHSPLPLRILARQHISTQRAQFMDYTFLQDIVGKPGTPEFSGYNTSHSREQGHTVRPRTRAVYLPLIDMPPASPDTMLTAMVEVQHLTNTCGQTYTIFTNDQQLYRVVINVTWTYPDRFTHFIPRLGGMHTLMNFVGATGTLMADSGLEDVMKAAFGGVTKMLSGKNFPQNVRALRMVVEEIVRGLLTDAETVTSYTDLMDVMEERAAHSRTAKLWLDNLVKPVFIMLRFVRAEREGDWPLHLEATAEMIPYFFTSGHHNYARYCLYYLRSMAKLPEPVLDEFLKGNHVMRHQPGIWNGIWSDMYIESTFMRYGHGPGGIIGITLKPKALKRWALGLHICSQLTKDIAAIREGDDQITVTVHKEEMPSRKQTDAADRQHIREKLGISIDPLQPNGHPKGLINIVTGKVAPESVNVDRSIQIGTQQMREYEASWPDGFHKPLAKQVITMSASRKHIKVGHVPVYDTTLIYSRVLGLQKVRDIDLESVLKYELAPVPTSMFDINGDMRITKSKSTLKKKLQVEVSDRQSHPPDSIILDGCAVLWVINWPTHGTVEDYIKNLLSYLIECQKKCSTYLVFDRYYDNSIKRGTRNARAGKDASRQHQLLLGTPLPSQKVTLTVSSNKVQLITLICSYLRDHSDMLPQNGNSLVITGPDPTPVEICNEQVIQRIDLRTTHEEADVVIIQQVLYLASIGVKNIRVVADDTDVFVLLLFYYATRQLTCNVVMAGTSQGRTTVDIKATVNNNRDIIPDLLAAHVLSGCDTVAYLWGIGKITVLKVLSSGKHLTKLGQLTVEMADVIDEATHFVAACYSSPDSADMTALRYSVWSTKMSNPKLSSAPDLKTLPPTTAAFVEHVKRAHLQVAIWKAAMDADPPSVDPVQYGWSLDPVSSIFVPVSLPLDVSPAPDDVLKLIKCGCASSTPCSTSRCSCSAAQLSCSMFCSCHANNDCRNGHTRVADAAADDEIYEDESSM